MKSKLIMAGFAVAGAFLFQGCVTRQDIRGIQTDLYHIQQNLESKLGSVEDQTSTVQTSQADLRLDMNELSQNIQVLTSELQESRLRMNLLQSRLDDMEVSLRTRLDAQYELLSGSKFTEKPLPTTVFNLAAADFTQGRYDDAIKGFRSYIDQFPKGSRVEEAKLKIADAHAKKKDWSNAITSYNQMISDSPQSPFVPAAELRKAQAYNASGKRDLATRVLTKLIEKYPSRSEARTAQETLRNWAIEATE